MNGRRSQLAMEREAAQGFSYVAAGGRDGQRGVRAHAPHSACLHGHERSLALLARGRGPVRHLLRGVNAATCGHGANMRLNAFGCTSPQLQPAWAPSSPSPHHVKVSSPRCLPSTWLFSSRLWLKESLQWPVLSPCHLCTIKSHNGLAQASEVSAFGHQSRAERGLGMTGFLRSLSVYR